jgi:two-component system OmpR family sensor kinase/two-component system sensor histidine kinase BaeS
VSLRARIALLVAGVVIGAAVASVIAVRLVAESQFRSLVQDTDLSRAEALAPVLAEYFREMRSWEGVQELVSSLPPMRGMMMRGPEGRMPQAGRAAMIGAGDRVVLVDDRGVVVGDSGAVLLGTRHPPTRVVEGVPVRSPEGLMGSVFVGTMVDRGLAPADSAFLASIARAIVAATGIAALVAIAIGLLVAGRMTGPVRELTRAAEKAEQGDLDVEVSSRVGGEIGRLASAFNRMARSLREQEESRRRMTADSAHELRTPASLIQGTVEAMLDGVYPTDRATLQGLHEETLRLSRLVEDLGELSLLEAGRLTLELEPTDLGALVRREADRFAGAVREAAIELSVAADPALGLVAVDPGRMGQVLANLLSNALRHTPRGGSIEVAVTREGVGALAMRVDDSGPGIPEEERGKVFERYYRVDASRSAAAGGRGLGLAIAAGIVRAHGGSIRAEPARLGGASFVMVLPSGPWRDRRDS